MIRRPLTLRRLLIVMAAGGALYVGGITLLISMRLRPLAGELRRHSARMLVTHDDIGGRLVALSDAIDSIHALAIAGIGGRPAPDDEALRPLTELIRGGLDSLAAMRYVGFSGISAGMRVQLAGAATAESELGVTLLDALSQLGAGDAGRALETLRRADHHRQRTVRMLSAAQRTALEDIVRREEQLGEVTSYASEAVIWWLAIGCAILPLVGLFLRRRVHRPLSEIDRALTRIAGGSLDVAVTVERDDEIGRLAGQLNHMVQVLRQRAEDEKRRTGNLTERLGALLTGDDPAGLFDAIAQATTDALAVPCAAIQRPDGSTLSQCGVSSERVSAFRDLEAPVRRNGNVAGVLRARHPGGNREWTPEERGFISSMADIVALAMEAAERRSLQAQLAESQRLEPVGRLAGGVAHDFNNLLTAIYSHVDSAREQVPEHHAVASELEGIQHAATRAADLTRQLLAFARRQVAEPRVVNINGVAQKMDKLLRRLIGEDIELVSILDPALGSSRIDPTHLEQVIVNLAVNARDAMPGGGKLTIRTSNTALNGSFTRSHPEITPGNYVLLEVNDTGCGMDEATRLRIFEPFFTTKSLHRGTGLGLSTVYGIVRQAGGHVMADSRPGNGSTFRIFLPRVAEANTADGGEVASQSMPGGHETVLLAEDEDQLRDLVSRTLRRLGYRVLVAGNGTEALEVARRHEGRIDLVLTDVVMPLMNGRELARRLADQRPETPVLFMSGYAEPMIVHDGEVEPGVAFIAKPFTTVELAERLRAVLDSGVKERSPLIQPALPA